MGLIADSNAYQSEEKILSQHQSALTLLGSKLQNPSLKQLNWLDLACGKGQIISQLEKNLSEKQRNKLCYNGYDIHVEHTKKAEKLAERLGFKKFMFYHGDLRNYSSIIPKENKFEFITCTNTAHELQPGAFAEILIEAILRLSDHGELFIYDMESLTQPELGALPLRGAEIGSLVNTIFEALNSEFRVQPSSWKHKSCIGWSITLQREYITNKNNDFIAAKETITSRIDDKIKEVLNNRFKECNNVLTSFCKFGAETAEDEQSKINSLFEFWAIYRAKEGRV